MGSPRWKGRSVTPGNHGHTPIGQSQSPGAASPPGTRHTATWGRRSSGTGPPPTHGAGTLTRALSARRTTGTSAAGILLVLQFIGPVGDQEPDTDAAQ